MNGRQRWLTIARWFFASRLAIAALGVIGVATFTDQRKLAETTAALQQPTQENADVRSRPLSAEGVAALDVEATWHKWDARWYEEIASQGYGHELDSPHGQALAGYFPLYPMAVRALWAVLPFLSFFWVAALFSNVVTLAALFLVARSLVPDHEALRSVLAVTMMSAGSFYLSIPYAESLFLLLVVAALVATRHRQYELAGLLAGLSAVTKVHGFALIAVPAVACWLDRDAPASRRLMRAGIAAALFAAPIVIYFFYLASVQGSWSAFVARQALWGNPSPYPLYAFTGFVHFPRRLSNWLHGGFWFVYAGLLIRYWRRMPLGEALFCAGALVISTQQEAFHGVYRYVVTLVPLSLAVAQDRRDLRLLLIALNIVFGVVMLLAFVTWNRLTV